MPRDLPLAQQDELLRQFARETCYDQYAFSLAIHYLKVRDRGFDGMTPYEKLYEYFYAK